jgi:hypothetical protein
MNSFCGRFTQVPIIGTPIISCSGMMSSLILLKNPIAEALFMLIDVERRMIFHCGSSLQ